MIKKPELPVEVVPIEIIERCIFALRDHRVMLDRDLADLYGVETRALNQAVKRNQERFPEDFMFQLNPEEAEAILSLRSQSVILKRGQHIKFSPHVFTEHGAVMLATVLKSPRAVRTSIQVVRAFVRLRQLLATNEKLAKKIEDLERKVGKHDFDLEDVLRILRKLLDPPPPISPKRPIGFLAEPKK